MNRRTAAGKFSTEQIRGILQEDNRKIFAREEKRSPYRKPEKNKQRPFWRFGHMFSLLAVLLLVVVLSYGRCYLINNLIGKFGALPAFFILLLLATPVVVLAICQFFWEFVVRNLKEVRQGNFLLTMGLIIGLVIIDMLIIILPNFICFIYNLFRAIFWG